MLFRYGNKVYVRPFANKMVEVNIIKKGSEYDVQPTNNKVEITSEIENELYSITIEEAYNMIKGSEKQESSLKSKKIFKD